MKARWHISLLVASTLAGCATNRGTIGDHPFQKRQLNSGWHLDLGLRPQYRHADRIARMETLGPATAASPTIVAAEPLASNGTLSFQSGEEVVRPEVSCHPTTTTQVAQDLLSPTSGNPPPTTSEGTIGQWNPWAVPAFIVALGTVAYAILGTSEIIVVLAVVCTLLLASLALRKGRTNEWRGKGFAIAALMIGALAGLITLIALIAGA